MNVEVAAQETAGRKQGYLPECEAFSPSLLLQIHQHAFFKVILPADTRFFLLSYLYI